MKKALDTREADYSMIKSDKKRINVLLSRQQMGESPVEKKSAVIRI